MCCLEFASRCSTINRKKSSVRERKINVRRSVLGMDTSNREESANDRRRKEDWELKREVFLRKSRKNNKKTRPKLLRPFLRFLNGKGKVEG